MRLPRTLVTLTAAGLLTLGGVGVTTLVVAPMASAVTVADAQGVEVSTLGDALTAAATARIEQQVVDGDLTRDEADEALAALPDRIAALLTDEIADRQGRRGEAEGDEATDAEPAASTAGV